MKCGCSTSPTSRTPSGSAAGPPPSRLSPAGSPCRGATVTTTAPISESTGACAAGATSLLRTGQPDLRPAHRLLEIRCAGAAPVRLPGMKRGGGSGPTPQRRSLPRPRHPDAMPGCGQAQERCRGEFKITKTIMNLVRLRAKTPPPPHRDTRLGTIPCDIMPHFNRPRDFARLGQRRGHACRATDQ